jgi:hypothetical protein
MFKNDNKFFFIVNYSFPFFIVLHALALRKLEILSIHILNIINTDLTYDKRKL